jgi:predicted house-cleaning NTP pyrophosphatase (Maf/HAM1 superfamily)
MSERPTPETDSYADRDWWTLFRANKHARKLERERDEARDAFVIATDQMVIAQGNVREANKERDEVQEKYDNLATEHMLVVNKLCEERNEARAEIQRLRLDAQKEAEHHDRMVKELEELYDKLKS